MSSKRKLPFLGLGRRVRARRDEEWEPEADSGHESSGGDVSDEGVGGEASGDEGRSAPSDDGSESPSEVRTPPRHRPTRLAPVGSRSCLQAASDDDDGGGHDAATPHVDLSSVSFGALARAQASLPPLGRRSGKPRPDSDSQGAQDAPRRVSSSSSSAKAPAQPLPKRSSKHAPQEQSSKRQVSRRREILPDLRRKARDPRFDPLVGRGRLDEAKAGKAYAFLDEYRQGEMSDLRAQIKKTKNAVVKEDLKRCLMSMESKAKTRARKEDEERLLEEHRAREKELVAQGKTPFYLKKSEQKKRLLTKRFEGMSKGQVDRAIERKRKKVAGQEKKELGALLRERGPRREA